MKPLKNSSFTHCQNPQLPEWPEASSGFASWHDEVDGTHFFPMEQPKLVASRVVSALRQGDLQGASRLALHRFTTVNGPEPAKTLFRAANGSFPRPTGHCLHPSKLGSRAGLGRFAPQNTRNAQQPAQQRKHRTNARTATHTTSAG